MRTATGVLLAVFLTAPVSGQTPQPFPRPGGSPQQPSPSTAAPPAVSRPAPPPPAAAAPPQTAPAATAQPSESAAPSADAPAAETLVFPVYPTAQFIASYDAGRGQRYYLFGTNTPYSELVTYYRAQLKERGDEVFDAPPTHMFQIGRFRDETMAFPPGVTVKDWTWGGSQGYPNPKLGAEPARYRSVIMIVPPPPAPAPAAR